MRENREAGMQSKDRRAGLYRFLEIMQNPTGKDTASTRSCHTGKGSLPA
jgi:hypothetical protein